MDFEFWCVVHLVLVLMWIGILYDLVLLVVRKYGLIISHQIINKLNYLPEWAPRKKQHKKRKKQWYMIRWSKRSQIIMGTFQMTVQ
jgi:hypothetical protein